MTAAGHRQHRQRPGPPLGAQVGALERIDCDVDAGDEVVGAFPAAAQVEIEKTTGGNQKLSGADREPVTRGGKGRPVFKRGKVKRLQLPPPELPNLMTDEDLIEG